MIWIMLLCFGPGTRSYYSTDEALATVFPEATQHQEICSSWEQVPLEVRQGLLAQTHLKDARTEGELRVFAVAGPQGPLGWAVLTEEFGKHQPMTIMVGVQPDGVVKAALLVTFRENRGSGIKHPKFQRQFNGKTREDATEVGIDIVHVSGSTISSRAMALGVRKSLFLVQGLSRVNQP